MTAPMNGLIVVAKRGCPTCMLVEPLLTQLEEGPMALRVLSQDDPGYGPQIEGVEYDDTLEHSYRLNIEFVPTLIRIEQRLGEPTKD